MDSPDSISEKPNNSALEPPKESKSVTFERDDKGRFVKPEEDKSLYQDFTADEMRLLPLKRYFSLDMADPAENGRLENILEELKDLGITDTGDVMTRIKELELKLGRDDFENRPAKILMYLRLTRDVQDKVKQLKAMEWGDVDRK